jgi:hypothetical protein
MLTTNYVKLLVWFQLLGAVSYFYILCQTVNMHSLKFTQVESEQVSVCRTVPAYAMVSPVKVNACLGKSW